MSRKHSTALGIGAALGGAAVATFISMGTAQAQADYPTADDGYEIVFGAPGNTGVDAGQIASNVAADDELTDTSAGDEAAWTTDAIQFEQTAGDHGLEQLIYALDPSAYALQSTPGIDGYLIGANAGDYLVPDDTLGYLGTELDAFLLSPLGLDPALLGPVLDTLLGFPTG
jgi:hypothetical protein